MTEYKVWAFARSAAPNLPALEEQLAEVMREADRRGYIIVNSCMEQKLSLIHISMKPDIQICNHNYLLANASHRLEERPLLLRQYQALVVDEAHISNYMNKKSIKLNSANIITIRKNIDITCLLYTSRCV